jgi:asparagine synthase (glutamine-hydrolysing)
MLQDAVRLELRADVPIGGCLSGGLDSSTIVCLMSRLLPGHCPPPQTFSACSDDPRCDERRYIHAVVAATGASSHEVFPDPVRLYEELPSILRHQEEPFAGTSVMAQWSVMRAAHQAGVKVLLDGQGADELLLGYPGYIGSRLADLLRTGRWLEGMHEWKAWRSIHGGLHCTAKANLLRGIMPEETTRWLRGRVTGDHAWLAPQFLRELQREPRSISMPQWHGRTALGAHTMRSVLRDLPALLHYEDRNAMAFSVEARVPFLDHRLVEWLVRLPPGLKLHRGMTKVVLREAMDGILPEEIRRRTDKMGFVTPEDHWLRETWRPQIDEVFTSATFQSRPYWRASVLRDWYRQYCERQMAVGPTVWRWVNLELWLREFCD